MSEPIGDRILTKKKVRAAFIEPVEYIDIQIGASAYHVRCASREQAEKLAGISNLGETAVVLEGEEERTYVEKIKSDRREKRSGEVKKEKAKGQTSTRGKDRVVKKLEAVAVANTHKFFGDND